MSHAVAVGTPYHPARRRWPEGISYNYRGGEHEMRFVLTDPTASEVDAIAAGALALALYVHQPLIVRLDRFGPEGGSGISWGDAPFTLHRVPTHERSLPTDDTPGVLRIVLVDGHTGFVRAVRPVLLVEGFAAALHTAIRAQATAPWNARAFEDAVLQLYRRHGAPAAIARAASHAMTLGPKSGERRGA